MPVRRADNNYGITFDLGIRKELYSFEMWEATVGNFPHWIRPRSETPIGKNSSGKSTKKSVGYRRGAVYKPHPVWPDTCKEFLGVGAAGGRNGHLPDPLSSSGWLLTRCLDTGRMWVLLPIVLPGDPTEVPGLGWLPSEQLCSDWFFLGLPLLLKILIVVFVWCTGPECSRRAEESNFPRGCGE